MKILYSYNDKEIKRLEKESEKIIKLEDKIENLSDVELANETYELKERLKEGESLDNILYEAFAVCREACFRILEKKQYKVQLMGGIALHQGRIIEMKTGEGKTITELCPAYLNALTGKGVHIITANEYLATRDKEEMEKVFKFLNISVGLIKKNTKNKKEEYEKDIIYTTDEEIGFDYLRDNLVYDINDKVQGELNFVIIDEIDSVLIDDAKTPLIISEEENTDFKIYYNIDKIIKNLKYEDYYIDKKDNSIFLSNKGITKIERLLNIGSLILPKNDKINHIIHQSLIANYLLNLDKNYIIKDDKILLIDENTGRIAEGRVYSDDLQQCIEAKEGIKIKAGSKTLATITYQSFFKLYKKISGMSGTVKTEENEFKELYNLDVVVIPTNKKIKRIDKIDRVFIDKKSKLEAILNDVIISNKNGQPILIGTQSIKESEEIYKLLKSNDLKVKLLNARNEKEEADIIKTAGEKESIIVATNIAGRGTDIILNEDSLKVGGLKVIGSGRSKELRIDNQLIGRSGRQGEVGESQIYISCEDDLLHLYGEDRLKNTLNKKRYKKDEIDYKYAKKYIKLAQRYVKSINFNIRKNTIRYDEVIGLQRDIIYRERKIVLSSKKLGELISKMLIKYVENIVFKAYEKVFNKECNKNILLNSKIKYLNKDDFDELKNIIKKDFDIKLKYYIDREIEKKIFSNEYMINILEDLINNLIDHFNELFVLNNNIDMDYMRRLFLNIIDNEWKEYLKIMDYLKYYVINQSYNQKDPIEVYRIKSEDIFNQLNEKIINKFIENIYKGI